MSIIKANTFFDKHIEFEGPTIILDGLITPDNIGAVLRLAGNIACKQVIITERIELKQTKIEKIARNSMQYVEIRFMSYSEIVQTFSHLIAIETSSNAKNIYNSTLPLNSTFIVGNEKYGISEELLTLVQEEIYIPMPGKVKSLNVSHALAITLFEWYRQNS